MLAELDWLRKTPSDFRETLKALRLDLAEGRLSGFEERLHALASFKLDVNLLHRLATTVTSYLDGVTAPGPLAHAKVGIIGSGTLTLLSQAVVGSALRHRLLLQVVDGEYGSAVREALDANSKIRTAGLDIIAILPDHRFLGLDQPRWSAQEAHSAVNAAITKLESMTDGLRPSCSAIIVSNVPPPVEPLFGSLDVVQVGTVHSMTTAFNAKLAEWASSKGVVVIDAARTASSVGLDHWHNAEQWNSAKFPFSDEIVPLFADVIARTVAAIRGTTRKCLILDLDHTLWGGVIGDDGLEGIALGQGSAKGEAFLAIQQSALNLRDRGIVLAVCSKNNDDVARRPFREHPDMLLKEDHIAVFTANWLDKAANIRSIAASLNIGLDALVFLDDNPVEREQVRRELPMVAVPELTDNPADYPRLLLSAGYFEAIGFAQEDRDRANTYQANIHRAAVAASSDIAGHLASLEMVADIRPFDGINRARIAQLINKSNQFNLTTRRYTENDIAKLEGDQNILTMQVRLTDRFGANGMISVIIINKLNWEIDTWLMSCRVLGRRVEEAVLAQIARLAIEGGIHCLTGRYIPSSKNQLVADHYSKLGFTQISYLPSGESVWSLDLSAFRAPNLPILVDVTGY